MLSRICSKKIGLPSFKNKSTVLNFKKANGICLWSITDLPATQISLQVKETGQAKVANEK
jgi:hypothetical protein